MLLICCVVLALAKRYLPAFLVVKNLVQDSVPENGGFVKMSYSCLFTINQTQYTTIKILAWIRSFLWQCVRKCSLSFWRVQFFLIYKCSALKHPSRYISILTLRPLDFSLIGHFLTVTLALKMHELYVHPKNGNFRPQKYGKMSQWDMASSCNCGQPSTVTLSPINWIVGTLNTVIGRVYIVTFHSKYVTLASPALWNFIPYIHPMLWHFVLTFLDVACGVEWY